MSSGPLMPVQLTTNYSQSLDRGGKRHGIKKNSRKKKTFFLKHPVDTFTNKRKSSISMHAWTHVTLFLYNSM